MNRDAAVRDEVQDDPDNAAVRDEVQDDPDDDTAMADLLLEFHRSEGRNNRQEDLGDEENHESQIQEYQLENPPLPLSEEGIIGQGWRGPFEIEVTEPEMEMNAIAISKSNFDKFIKPFLTEEDLRKGEIPVTMYSDEDVNKELYMTLKFSESDDSHSFYTFIGSEFWKDFCKEHKSLFKDGAFVKIWMFRHARDQNLCSAITSWRLELSSSQIIFQRNEEPPSQYSEIIGKCSGPFSKQLRRSDVTYHKLTIIKKHSRDFIEPLLNDNGGEPKEEIRVTMFNATDGNEEFLMNLRVQESGQYFLADGWKDFCQSHKSMIQENAYVTLWMFLHKNDKKLCCIITSGRVVEEEDDLPELPPVASLNGLIGNCSKPFVKKLTRSDVNENRDDLRISKNKFDAFLEHLLDEKENCSDDIPVTVYDAEGTDFSVNLKKWISEELALNQGWRDFRRKHNAIKDQEFVIWMFRNKVDEKLCFVIVSKGCITAAEAEPAQLEGGNQGMQ